MKIGNFLILSLIINKNFKNIVNNQEFTFNKKIEIIKDFEHNHIVLVNGSLKSSNFKFEEKEKVLIQSIKSLDELNYIQVIIFIV